LLQARIRLINDELEKSFLVETGFSHAFLVSFFSFEERSFTNLCVLFVLLIQHRNQKLLNFAVKFELFILEDFNWTNKVHLKIAQPFWHLCFLMVSFFLDSSF
jgi:hypothetical protein